MNKIYHLSTCDTCRKILARLNTTGIELINLRQTNITAEDLDAMKAHTGRYEALFNKKAQKWKAMPLEERPVSDEGFRSLILGEYTFLIRPAAIIGNTVIVGNDPAAVDALTEALRQI